MVADALSRLNINQTSTKIEESANFLAENLNLENLELPEDAFPLIYKTIMIIQKKIKIYHCQIFLR